MQMVTVAFIDDHPVMHEGLSAVFERSKRYSLIASGSAAADIPIILAKHHPDIIIVDLGMPGDVFGTIADTKEAYPCAKIIVFTASTDIEDALHAFDVGAVGYALKRHAIDQLDGAIETVLRGDIYITPSMSVAFMQALKDKSANTQTDHTHDLSRREIQIINSVMLGKRNSEIASMMNLSEKTIKNYMSRIMQKFDVRNRLELMLALRGLGRKDTTEA